MRAFLPALLLACLAAPAAAQPLLTVSADPYDGSGSAAPLVIRNVGASAVALDSIAFRAGASAPARGVFLSGTFSDSGRSAGFDCGRYRTCHSTSNGSTTLAETIAAGESLSLVAEGYCVLCKSAAGESSAADTMLVYYAGLATPLRVRVVGYRQAVADEPSPDAARLGLSVWPNPAAGRGTVRLALGAPAASATASVSDALGRRVAVLHDGPLAAGEATFTADTATLPSGVYVVRIEGAGLSVSAHFTVAR